MTEENHRILITGGLGFIGKNLYVRLKESGLGADIFSNVPLHNNDPFSAYFTGKLILGDIARQDDVERITGDYDIIYSLAGISGAAISNYSPLRDIQINLLGHLNILEACRRHNHQAKIIFPSSRLVYGKSQYLPVNEKHPLNPESVYAIHKLTAEYYYLLYARLYGIKTVVLRISNPYGPYQDFSVKTYGIINHFIMQAIKGEDIRIFGDGSQKRDYIYISDLADLLIKLGKDADLSGKIFNIGLGTGISLKQAVMEMKKHLPRLKVDYAPWPKEYLEVETGDYITDCKKIFDETGWKPVVSFEEGIRLSVGHYLKFI